MQTQKQIIGVIGTGRLGLCWALTMAKTGRHVLCADRNEHYVSQLTNKSFQSLEPGVNELLRTQSSVHFFAQNAPVLSEAELIFVLVPTPSLPNGAYDHSAIESVAQEILHLPKPKQPKHLVISSTVMPGYCDSLAQRLAHHHWRVSYNPEFIAQGRILYDQEHPDLVLIGSEGSTDSSCAHALRQLHEDIIQKPAAIHLMSRLEAEITKIALNCFLTTKIAFANSVGDLAGSLGADPNVILGALASDSRIGVRYLNFGFGFGGPCLPRDNRAWSAIAESLLTSGKHETVAQGVTLLSQATDSANKAHLQNQIHDFCRKNPNRDTTYRIGPVAYSSESRSLEESQQLQFALSLAKLGYKVVVCDDEDVLAQVRLRYAHSFFGFELNQKP